jgi:molybdopterin molybdotransferase
VTGLPTIEEALALVLSHVRRLELETVRVDDALGRVAGRDAVAEVDLPPFDSSAMDGFAVRAAETPGELRLGGRSAAGRPADAVLTSGVAFAISTGAVVPEGADAVVPVEVTTTRDALVAVAAVRPGENVRPRGGDIRAGEVVVSAGSRLGPPQVGALAAAGIATLACARAPRVAVLATGTELRRPGEPLGPGEIYESNSTLLAAQLRSAGAQPWLLDPVADDAEATRAALATGLEADVLITSGGVSVGRHDLVRPALAELGVEEVFWRVAVKPGKPVVFGRRGSTLVFGLPGNPVSSLVGFELFVRPALNALQGARSPGPSYEPGVLARSLRRGPDRDELVRARTLPDSDRTALEPLGGQASHMIARAAAADALVLVPRGEGELPAGASVRWLRI